MGGKTVSQENPCYRSRETHRVEFGIQVADRRRKEKRKDYRTGKRTQVRRTRGQIGTEGDQAIPTMWVIIAIGG